MLQRQRTAVRCLESALSLFVVARALFDIESGVHCSYNIPNLWVRDKADVNQGFDYSPVLVLC